MDIHAFSRGRKPSRKPLQDTTTTANNYSSPTPASRHRRLKSSESAQDVTPQRRYSHIQEKTYNTPISSAAERRCSMASTATPVTPASKPAKLRKGKARVGPWILGRTLGKGSSGRVRLAKHIETGKLAAVKIVGKGQQENSSPYSAYGQGEVGGALPSGLEREVVIMKLIDHPNVMGLWDVWENRGEL